MNIISKTFAKYISNTMPDIEPIKIDPCPQISNEDIQVVIVILTTISVLYWSKLYVMGYESIDRVIVMIMFVLLFTGVTIVHNYTTSPTIFREGMTLKTFCDERDRNCIISCTTIDHKINRKCYAVCVENSPIC